MFGPIKSALVDIDRASEFTGDVVDQYSALVDLENDYSHVLVYIPVIDSATVSLYLQRDGLVATVPSVLHILDADATGSFLHATTAGTTAKAIIYHVGATQYLRIYTSASQTADRTFYVRGFN
jgi:hypothetical protein